MNRNDIGYMARTRRYYRAQGYTTDYQWAHFDDVPMTTPRKPLSESRIVIISTAMPGPSVYKSERDVEAAPVDPPPESMFTDHLSWDKDTTHTRDIPSFLPIDQLQRLAAEGVVGGLGPRFFCVPTEYSQRNTREADAPRILEMCRQDQIDLALLVPL
jgi:D-proline reductase (dithiol) PrdB